MLDGIGLGSVIADLIYVVIIVFGFLELLLFLNRKNVFGAFFSISVTANLFFYLFFLGRYGFYSKYLYDIINIYWPGINVVLLILIVIKAIKKKHAKTN